MCKVGKLHIPPWEPKRCPKYQLGWDPSSILRKRQRPNVGGKKHLFCFPFIHLVVFGPLGWEEDIVPFVWTRSVDLIEILVPGKSFWGATKRKRTPYLPGFWVFFWGKGKGSRVKSQLQSWVRKELNPQYLKEEAPSAPHGGSFSPRKTPFLGWLNKSSGN